MKTKLQQLRENQNMSIEDLASKCVDLHFKLGHITYLKDWILWLNKIETGKYAIQKEYLAVLCKALQCDSSEVIE